MTILPSRTILLSKFFSQGRVFQGKQQWQILKPQCQFVSGKCPGFFMYYPKNAIIPVRQECSCKERELRLQKVCEGDLFEWLMRDLWLWRRQSFSPQETVNYPLKSWREGSLNHLQVGVFEFLQKCYTPLSGTSIFDELNEFCRFFSPSYFSPLLIPGRNFGVDELQQYIAQKLLRCQKGTVLLLLLETSFNPLKQGSKTFNRGQYVFDQIVDFCEKNMKGLIVFSTQKLTYKSPPQLQRSGYSAFSMTQDLQVEQSEIFIKDLLKRNTFEALLSNLAEGSQFLQKNFPFRI